MEQRLLVLFDGVCQFCHASVNFIMDHDPHKHFCFATLQSPLGQAVLERFDLADKHVESVIVVEKQHCYLKSTAGLRIARHLQPPWPILSLFIMVPQPLRDWGYDLLARHRYQWFGKLDQCRVPTPEVRERFVDLASFRLEQA